MQKWQGYFTVCQSDRPISHAIQVSSCPGGMLLLMRNQSISMIDAHSDSLVKLITMNMRHRMNKEETIFTGHGV